MCGLGAALAPEYAVIHLPLEMAGAAVIEPGEIVLVDFQSDAPLSLLADLAQRRQANVVLWAEDATPELGFQTINCGVRGIIQAHATAEMLRTALRAVADGQVWYEKSLTDVMLSQKRKRLTKREGQLVRLLGEGLKNKEIAERLMITEGTVKVYFSKLYDKLGVADRWQLGMYARQNFSDRASDTAPLRMLVLPKKTDVPRAA